ncbi:glycosyltransferase family 2 protein [Paraburkholderia megapolitana]|uniref:glycosyltransferase family 2 protein n=1 Tax=Paraburkholderia megapolitana TaxID=420953 RepID=UPI0038BB8496
MTPGKNPDDSQSNPDPGAASHASNTEPELVTAKQQIEAPQDQLLLAQEELARRASTEIERIKPEIELQSLRDSISWRITAPIRQVSVLTRALRLALGTIRHQALQQGSYVRVFAHYGAILRRDGIHGVRARILRLLGFAYSGPSDAGYRTWIDRYDTFGETERARATTMMATFTHKPRISIVVPVYNCNASFLEAMIQSVRDQIYPNWELCIADDASTSPEPAQVLRKYMALDARIKVVFRETNGHISEASNSALSIATGEYVALLDHDDVLPPQALFMVVNYIHRYANGRMFYSDEDKLTADGERTTPYFKCDWNPEMFLTRNMFSHLGVFETTLIREAGGFRKGFEGNQDYDLALRCVEIAGHDNVIHIPHVLYHWRITQESTAGSASRKPYALQASIRAMEEHLQRIRVNATVEQPFEDLDILRIRYAVPQPTPKVSLIIPTRDGVDLLRQCIDSVTRRTLYPNYEIIVVDNGSVDDNTLKYLDEIREKRGVRVLRDDSPFNFSALNNRAAIVATGEYLCLLNNDIEVISPDWLNEMVGLASQPGSGAVGASLWYPNDTLQHGGILIGLGGVASHMHYMLKHGQFGYFSRAVVTQNLSAITAACLVIRKSTYAEVGGLDENFAVAYNDVDFCLRVREAGYRNVWTPHAQLYHHESASRGSDMNPERRDRFIKETQQMESRWASVLECDPAYNPNLSLSTKGLPFALAEPPRKSILE